MKKFILYMILMMMASPAFATYPAYTVCPSGCDFSTLGATITDLSTNHATPATPVTITISGSWSGPETATVVITGVTLTSVNRLTISTTGSAVNNGLLPTGSGGYWIKPTTGDGIDEDEPWVTINGLAFDMSTSGGNAILYSNFQDDVKAMNNYFNLTAGWGISWADSQPRGICTFYNNICNGNHSASFNVCVSAANGGDGSTIVYMYNNTSYGMGQSFDARGTSGQTKVFFSNNIASNSVTDSVLSNATGSNNICDKASECSSTTLTSGINSATSYTSYYSSPSTGNFTPISGSILIQGGVNLYPTFNMDVTGSMRVLNGPWEVGAFRFVSTPSNPSKVFNAYNMNQYTISTY